MGSRGRTRTIAPAKACAGAAAALAVAVTISACASTVSTSAFHGEEHAVAQKVADLQSHATAGEESKICGEDLSASVVERLGGRSACEAAVKRQLNETDNLEATVRSVSLDPSHNTATATVKSVHNGKQRESKLTLHKEGGSWRISGLG
jgi:hypothetical protein